jgi:hypothetical protein
MPLERPPKPLVSTRAADPEVEEEIDAFVVGLGETVDGLQDAEAGGDLGGLERAALALQQTATKLGYEPMAEAAGEIVAACGERALEALHKAVWDVTRLAQRIRRGHRTAA